MNRSILAATTLAVAAAAGSGSIASPKGIPAWYSRLRKPPYQPPAAAFPVAWTTLYGDIAATSAVAIDRFRTTGQHDKARRYTAALGVNLVLNAGWSWLFFGYHKLGASALGAAVLTASSADLARRAGASRSAGRTGPVGVPVVVRLRDRPGHPRLAAQPLRRDECRRCCGFVATCGCTITRPLSPLPQNEEVLACFVLDPRLEASSGRRRLQFLGDSLRQLRDDLDGRLLVTRGRPEERIPRIAKDISASSVHISDDFAPFGRRRDERVRAALGSVPLVATGSPYLVSPGRVTKPDGTPYQVFTPFLRTWREVGWRPPARSGPESARWLDPAQVGIQTVRDPRSRRHTRSGCR